ncbi:MAG: electron transfer flavoprotein subunit alpha/FixB family protein [Thermoplasmata archaeon]|jgi:electron transfer flavoprotein alpha subunit
MKALLFTETKDLAAQILTLLRNNYDIDLYTLSKEDVSDYGAKNVFHIETDFPYADNLSQFISEEFKKNNYDVIFMGSSSLTRDMAGMLSEILNLEAITEIMKIEFSNNKFYTERFFYGGKTIIREESDARIFTFLAGLIDPQKVEYKSNVNKIRLDKNSRVSLLKEIEKPKSSVNLEKADIIVSAGRGIGKKEGLAIIQQLADLLHGEVGGSRPVCLDYHWLSEERQVGLSGKRVKPKIYIAAGISGQVQHIAGMRGSKTVIAINKDKNAPIFNECDYGIVGDLYVVIPKLIEKLKK